MLLFSLRTQEELCGNIYKSKVYCFYISNNSCFRAIFEFWKIKKFYYYHVTHWYIRSLTQRYNIKETSFPNFLLEACIPTSIQTLCKILRQFELNILRYGICNSHHKMKKCWNMLMPYLPMFNSNHHNILHIVWIEVGIHAPKRNLWNEVSLILYLYAKLLIYRWVRW